MLAAIVLNVSAASAQPALGAAAGFAVLGGPMVTCTTVAAPGSTVPTITGDVGVVMRNGFANTNCRIAGTVHAGDPAADAAYAAFLTAYNSLGTTPPRCTTLTGTLAGQTLPPGDYCFPAAATLTGTLFLDAQFNANAAWTFRIGTLGTGALTGTNFNVELINSGKPCNVTWWVREGATLTDSVFHGTILAGAGLTVTRGSLINGRALAKAAVTLTDTTVTACTGGSGGGVPPMDKCEPPHHKRHHHHHGDGHDDDDNDHHHDDNDHHDHDDKDHHDKDKGHKDKDKDKGKDKDHKDKDDGSKYNKRW